MSTETLVVAAKSQGPEEKAKLDKTQRPSRRTNSSSSSALAAVEQVWCAPMGEAGEWVITWTRTPAALSYEVQTSLDGCQWSSGSKFSSTRAVLLLGPGRRWWVRVRAMGQDGPGSWSDPTVGEKTGRMPVAA